MKYTRLPLMYLGLLAALIVINVGLSYFLTSDVLFLWFAGIMAYVESVIFSLLWVLGYYDRKRSLAVFAELDKHKKYANDAITKVGCEIAFKNLHEYKAQACYHRGHYEEVMKITLYLMGKWNAFNKSENNK